MGQLNTKQCLTSCFDLGGTIKSTTSSGTPSVYSPSRTAKNTNWQAGSVRHSSLAGTGRTGSGLAFAPGSAFCGAKFCRDSLGRGSSANGARPGRNETRQAVHRQAAKCRRDIWDLPDGVV